MLCRINPMLCCVVLCLPPPKPSSDDDHDGPVGGLPGLQETQVGGLGGLGLVLSFIWRVAQHACGWLLYSAASSTVCV
jgi:hypothetical protein